MPLHLARIASDPLRFCRQDLVTLWIPLDPTTAESTLEYVRGSHRGPIFDSKYGQHRSMAIPDIEAQRLAGEVEVLGFPTQPGDVVAFHQATLHGGGSTVRGQQRRMMALRFIGANAFRSPRTGIVDVRAQAKTAGEGAGAEGEAPIVIGTEVGSGVPLVRPGNPSDPPDSDWTAGDYGVMGTDARMVQVLGSANPARASNEKPGLGPARL